ncbi:MAG: MBL fold metallo-hydrolase [Armatimonadaceae bacterium]
MSREPSPLPPLTVSWDSEGEIADVVRLPFFEANVYFVGAPGQPWAIVDTATEGRFAAIRDAAEARYGKESRPEAIYLTHGHPDHVGSALALATYWDVPVFVHRMELPYVTGKADYPPPDPTVGGAFSIVARFFTLERTDLGAFVRPLPPGALPGMAGWQAVETPGHSPGHVSFFREADRALLAGDACATVDMDLWDALVLKKPGLARPPSPFTPDWVNARKSLKRLAALRPTVLACGHGEPLSFPELPDALQGFAEQFIIPLKGRYVSDPAQFDENGVTYLPPQPRAGFPLKAVALSAAALIVLGIYWNLRNRSEQTNRRAGKSD